MTIRLLNTSVITSFGSYTYQPLTLCGLKRTLEHAVPVNRTEYTQQTGEKAIVFKLKSRIPAGVVLSRQEIEEIGFEFGL
ncbi:MAG: DUF1874 domain-containing protein [Acidobacteriota bacterium]